MVKSLGREGSVSGYFRGVFAEHPEWLHETSNDVILARYRSDHNMAASADVEQRIKQNLANIKSHLRKQAREQGKRKPGRPRKEESQALTAPAAPTVAVVLRRPSSNRLEVLEEQIDDCLTAAKHLDRDGLEEIIHLLRRARNAVVWKLGQP